MTPSGQSMNQSVYMKSVCLRRIAIADMYRAEENAAIYLSYWSLLGAQFMLVLVMCTIHVGPC